MGRRSRISRRPEAPRPGPGPGGERAAASAVARLFATRRTALSCAVALALALAGCRDRKATGAMPTVDAGVDVAHAAHAAASGSARQRPVTTSSSIAWNNLSGDIAERVRADDPSPSKRLQLVERLLARAQTLGSIADMELADDVAGRAVATSPKAWEAELARALAHAALHRFEPASAALDRADALKAPAARLAAARASIEIARGRYDAAAARLAKDEAHLDSTDLATAAVLAARMQRPAESDRLFELARARFDSVSPFPLAWMDLQRALVLEAQGREALAREYYDEACAVLPEYAHAAVHLAASEPPAKAVERLTAVQKTSDDPDVLAALAAAHRRAGDDAESGRVLALAKRRFDEVVAKHREAFADHAARFWLDLGGDPKKALELARANAELRPTEEALDLWMAAAAAADDKPGLCAAARATTALAYASERARRVANATLTECASGDAGR